MLHDIENLKHSNVVYVYHHLEGVYVIAFYEIESRVIDCFYEDVTGCLPAACLMKQ